MRDLAILAIILGSVPLCFFSPYFGVLMWIWVAYFNPHRYAWGIAYNFPVALTLATPTLLGTLFTRQMNRQIFVRETVLLLCLWAWFWITFIYALQIPSFAGHITDARDQLTNVSKILLMTFLMVLLVTSKERLKYVLLVTALSFGARGIAGALFGLRTGGEFQVWGPEDSFIADNNAFALALNMALPILFFLAREEKNRLMRWALRVAFVSTIVSVILTYSRGGLLGLGVVMTVIAVRSRHKVLSAACLLFAAVVLLTYAPERWLTRMSTFMGGNLDQSAQERLIAWGVAWNIANDYPLTGAGFAAVPDVELFQQYQSEPLPRGQSATGPHSLYFQVLAEQGFIGLALYLALVASCFLSLRGLRRRARLVPSARWMISYSYMLEASMLGQMVSGAFLGVAYFDLFFQLIACTIIMRILYRKDVLEPVLARERVAFESRAGEAPA